LVFANSKKIKFEIQKIDEDAPQVIVSFNNVSKVIDENKKLVEKFSLKILRGERIGIIGKNGSGKTSLLKMIIGEMKPDSGTVKAAKDIAISYFDQDRSAINAKATIQEILCETGSDYVHLANGKARHICGYLKDFLFDPKDISTLSGTLSGGQQNRLLLAKTLANPGNFLILDEPTNDLDMDSLDMLQDYLEKYQGTLLVVSHDRDFLDNVATSILAFEGDGVITCNVGGYSDYLNYKEKYKIEEEEIKKVNEKKKVIEAPVIKKKSAYKNKIEIEKLLIKIEKLENKISQLSEELSDGEDRSAANLAFIAMEIAKYQSELEMAQERWMEIDLE
jgi:ATP-binding cassette subfamily F protein uup